MTRPSARYSPRLRALFALPLLAAGLLAAGCDLPEPPPEIDFSGPEGLVFDALGRGQRGSLRAPVERAIYDAETWAVYQDSLRPQAAFRPVDFEQTFVLLVALPRPTSGYAVEMLSVERSDSAVVATYTLEVPDEGCLTAPAETVPFTAVRVRRAEEPVQFVREHSTYNCDLTR